jgi:putative transcriptional regulator
MNKIKDVLRSQGRTQIWLANQLEITKSTMSGWCTNATQPPIEKLYKVAELLGVEIYDLLVPIEKTKKLC